jgi:formate hydrogenlyase transcriptional activator
MRNDLNAVLASEDFLRAIIDQVPILAWSCLPDGTAEFLNQRWLEYTGLRPEEASGWGWKVAIHPEDLGRLMATWLSILASGEPGQEEARLRRFDSEYRWFLFRTVPVRDGLGKIVRWYGTNTDIEDLKRAEEKLRQSESELRQLIDAVPQNILVLGPNRNPLYANRSLLEYHGVSSEDIQADDFRMRIYHPDDLERALIEAQRATARGVAWETEVRLRRKDGQYRWFLLRANPLRDEFGHIMRWYSTGFDIEDRKQAEEIRTAQARQAGVRADVSAAFSKPAPLREILLGCVESIVRHLDAAFARIWTLNKDGNMLELQASAGMYMHLDGPHGRIPMGKLKIGLIAEEKKPHLTNDVVNDPRVSDKVWAQNSGMVSFAGYPLIVEERLVGVMAMFARKPLSAVTLDSLGSVADLIAQGIERKRAEEKLRQDERELRRITDAIPQAISVLAPDGTTLHANEFVLDYTGLSLEDVKADDFRARLFHPDDLERLQDELRKALSRGQPFEAELRARRKDGQYRWFLVRYNPFRDENGNIIRWYATGTDIEDRKQAEERVQKENLALREEIDHSSMFEEIVGSSQALRNVLAQVAKVAPVDSTVLILGETGTGKELVARAIHKRSKRSSRAFIRVNCAAIPSSLIASELFGHEKGAFTGALQRRLGRFELADGGTIFLDEMGELPAETQIALLRVLQEREIERVGGSQPISVDVRVLAATNRDLNAAVATGAFRQDLFYRLNVFPIQTPPLRERVDDISLLVEYFIERYGKKAGKKFRNVNKKTLELFQAYDWPGNIRELQNVIERAVILCEGDTFSVDESWLRREPIASFPSTVPFVATLAEREREIIEAALTESEGRISGRSGAAAKLGIPRQTLESKIKALGIEKHRFRSHF